MWRIECFFPRVNILPTSAPATNSCSSCLTVTCGDLGTDGAQLKQYMTGLKRKKGYTPKRDIKLKAGFRTQEQLNRKRGKELWMWLHSWLDTRSSCTFAVSTPKVGKQISTCLFNTCFSQQESTLAKLLCMPHQLSKDFKSRKERVMAASEFPVQSRSQKTRKRACSSEMRKFSQTPMTFDRK